MHEPEATRTGLSAHRGRLHHLPELDSLRGLAAMVVVLDHFSNLWEPSSLQRGTVIWQHILFPLINGGASVSLFFLLSGLVLSFPYQRGTARSYRVFIARRLSRIYLPYAAALLLALWADHHFHQPIQVSRWFSQTWTEPLTWSMVTQHVLMIGNYNTAQINTAFWSLAVEMRISLIFPFICLPVLQAKRVISAALLPVIYVLWFFLFCVGSRRLDPVTFANASETMLGLLAFTAGIQLARWLDPIRDLWGSWRTPQKVLVFACSFLLLGWSGLLNGGHLWLFADPFTLLGGCGLLMSALCFHPIGRMLNRPLPAWLGRISYSLYLVHATVLFALVHLAFGRFSRMQILVPYLASSLALAALFFFLVERPSIRLSRSIGRSGRL